MQIWNKVSIQFYIHITYSNVTSFNEQQERKYKYWYSSTHIWKAILIVQNWLQSDVESWKNYYFICFARCMVSCALCISLLYAQKNPPGINNIYLIRSNLINKHFGQSQKVIDVILMFTLSATVPANLHWLTWRTACQTTDFHVSCLIYLMWGLAVCPLHPTSPPHWHCHCVNLTNTSQCAQLTAITVQNMFRHESTQHAQLAVSKHCGKSCIF